MNYRIVSLELFLPLVNKICRYKWQKKYNKLQSVRNIYVDKTLSCDRHTQQTYMKNVHPSEHFLPFEEMTWNYFVLYRSIIASLLIIQSDITFKSYPEKYQTFLKCLCDKCTLCLYLNILSHGTCTRTTFDSILDSLVFPVIPYNKFLDNF